MENYIKYLRYLTLLKFIKIPHVYICTNQVLPLLFDLARLVIESNQIEILFIKVDRLKKLFGFIIYGILINYETTKHFVGHITHHTNTTLFESCMINL